MDDIIIARRKRNSNGMFVGTSEPLIKMELPQGRFYILNKAAEVIGLKHRDAVMFALSKKERCGWIYKEDPEPDSYYPSKSGNRGYFRFTSKELMELLRSNFNINKNTVYFLVEDVPNHKDWFKFTLKPQV
jgi:hypothetical protein